MSPAGTGNAPGSGASPDFSATHVHIGPEQIDVPRLYVRALTLGAGAVVQFTGTVRDHSGTARVLALEYEAYAQMADTVLRDIVREAHGRWTLAHVGVVHRTGALALGDAAVCVTVAAAHREEAFTACRYIIDTLKARAPIWKKERLESGERRWVEEATPGAEEPAGPR